MFPTVRTKHSASRPMELLLAALAIVGLFTPRIASGQSAYEATLHSFSDVLADGYSPSPYTGLIMDSQGNLYGTTAFGGSAAASSVIPHTAPSSNW